MPYVHKWRKCHKQQKNMKRRAQTHTHTHTRRYTRYPFIHAHKLGSHNGVVHTHTHTHSARPTHISNYFIGTTENLQTTRKIWKKKKTRPHIITLRSIARTHAVLAMTEFFFFQSILMFIAWLLLLLFFAFVLTFLVVLLNIFFCGCCFIWFREHDLSYTSVSPCTI